MQPNLYIFCILTGVLLVLHLTLHDYMRIADAAGVCLPVYVRVFVFNNRSANTSAPTKTYEVVAITGTVQQSSACLIVVPTS